jgi:transglutaminase-like putative cysteine protease
MPRNTAPTDFAPYLEPTSFIDSDHPEVISFAREHLGSSGTDVERAVRIFYPVRDAVAYTPYGLTFEPETMTASYTLTAGKGFCVQKAVLLAAAARVAEIPSRLAFADVRNHLATERLLELLGSEVLIYHGYTELWIGGAWVKATPTFNLSLCEKLGVLPLEFDGVHDSVLQPFDRSGKRHMEYVRNRGTFADLPFDILDKEYEAAYPGLFAKRNDGARGAEGDFEKEAETERRGAL